MRKTNTVLFTEYTKPNFCLKHSNRLKPGLQVRELLFELILILLVSRKIVQIARPLL